MTDYDDSSNRLSLLGMEVPNYDHSAHAPMIAAPAAVGYGPTVAMPTLMGMMPEMKDFEEETDDDGLDQSNASVQMRVKSPGVRVLQWLYIIKWKLVCMYPCRR